ncbi:MAG TPA: DivIVA domain-containing protein [Acidimicrobiales bacterium]|jgi:DivIVA domain-containing protein|nr:DivIVA domain-containing protein [Acidimicrobiales bacterium]
MELTPQTLHAVEFREARRGGYNTRDVDDFLERVAAGVANLHDRLREIASRAEAAEARLLDAQHQIDELQRRPPAASSPIMAPAAPPAPSVNDTDDTLRRTLVLAQRTADATIKEAKQEANRLLGEARDEAARTRAAAEDEARRGADHARLSAEAEIDELLAEREALKSDIDALRSHIDDQRDHIRAGIDELRRVLDDPHTFSPLPAPPLADVERGGASPTMMPAAPPMTPEPDNGHMAAPDAGSPFDPGTRVASLQEAPETPPSQPMPFPRPDEARGPWLPSQLRTSPGDEPPPPLPRRGAGPNGAPAVPGGPGDATGRPSEWGRSVFDTEGAEGPEVPETP